MGRQNYPIIAKAIWNKNPILPYRDDDEFLYDEEVSVLALPGGKTIEIYTDGKNSFKFSSDSKTTGREDSQVGKYLEKYIYEKLNTIVQKFAMSVHFYGFVGKKGFQGYDIYVNQNYLDWRLAKELFRDAKIKTPEEIFTGPLYDISLDLLDSFIVRSVIEYPDSRNIYYRRKKS